MVITWARKVVNKYHQFEIVQAKVDAMHNQVKEFSKIFNPLFKRGIHLFWEDKVPMLSQKEYHHRLINCKHYHRQFSDMLQQSLSGKTVIEKLTGEFKIMFEFKAICTQSPYFSYLENVELSVMAKNMINMEMQASNKWKTIENYGKSKYRLRQ